MTFQSVDNGATGLHLIILILLLGFVGGCKSSENVSTSAKRGGTGGAILGGVTGAVIAQGKGGNPVKGAIIGAAAGGVVGAGVGAAVGARMDRQAKELQESLKDAEVVPVKDSTGTTVGVHIVVNSALLFDVNKADLRSEVQQSLDSLAASLTRYSETALVVVGHTDSDGAEEYNQRLSERRAQAVTTYLQAQGIVPERMRALGLGETTPIAPNDTPANKQKNRRVEIGIVPIPSETET